jgi:hypothetical protein
MKAHWIDSLKPALSNVGVGTLFGGILYGYEVSELLYLQAIDICCIFDRNSR